MVVFLITNFALTPGSYPAAVVYENDRDAAIRKLLGLLSERQIPHIRSELWTVSPLTPLPMHPKAIIINDSHQAPRSAVELRGPERRSTL